MIIMLVIVGVVLGAIVAFNLFKGHMIAKYMAESPTPTATVSTMKAEYQQWQPQLNAVGTLRAVRGVEVTTEVAGLVRSVNFKSGDEVQAGAVLAELNADSDIALLHSLEAQAELARTAFERNRAQFEAQAISQAQLDTDSATLKSAQAQAAQQLALVRKKTLRAPFAGRLGITKVNPGQYLNPADQLVTLQAIDPIYVDFFLPQQELQSVVVGQPLTLVTNAVVGASFTGNISAIDPKVMSDTRNVQVEATLANPKKQLLPGMFGRVDVAVGTEQRYLTLPQTAITYNPYGATVFIVKASDKKDDKGNAVRVAQQVFVKTGLVRGDQVAIVSGIEPGTEVVTSGGLKLKNGTPIKVDNSVQPANDPNPAPQER
jgi:membrane fusion protein (multidrug efflux system)